LANTAGLLPVLSFNPVNPLMGRANEPFTVQVAALCTFLANLLLTMDMAAIGLEVNLRQLIAVGGRALIAGLLSTVALGLGGLILLALLF
jgi:uncharacterized membrane protein YadS